MIRRFLFFAFPVLHPIKSVRHLRAVNAPWPELPVAEPFR